MVEVSEDTIESVGMAARGVEAGRRVGWAKAFEALRRANAAEHDVNILRGDVRALCTFAARIYGSLEVIAGLNRIDELFRGDNHDFKGFLPQGPLNQGRDAGRKLLADRATELAALRAEIADFKAERHALSRKAFEAAKREALQELMAEYGIAGEDELRALLTRKDPL